MGQEGDDLFVVVVVDDAHNRTYSTRLSHKKVVLVLVLSRLE